MRAKLKKVFRFNILGAGGTMADASPMGSSVEELRNRSGGAIRHYSVNVVC
jgi:putative component of toxin-antitoxin plasmid stabilization module